MICIIFCPLVIFIGSIIYFGTHHKESYYYKTDERCKYKNSYLRNQSGESILFSGALALIGIMVAIVINMGVAVTKIECAEATIETAQVELAPMHGDQWYYQNEDEYIICYKDPEKDAFVCGPKERVQVYYVTNAEDVRCVIKTETFSYERSFLFEFTSNLETWEGKPKIEIYIPLTNADK